MCDKDTALIKFASDPFPAVVSGQRSALIPSDLSFDSNTVERAALIDWLKIWAGIVNTSLNWLSVYFSPTTYSTEKHHTLIYQKQNWSPSFFLHAQANNGIILSLWHLRNCYLFRQSAFILQIHD